MSSPLVTNRRGWIASAVLLATITGAGALLAVVKVGNIKQAAAAAAQQPEPMEAVTVAVAKERKHRGTTTSIGTVLALRSVTLRNELSGTVRHVRLTPGQIVDAGTVLVALDVSVEEAELKAHEAQTALAETMLRRVERLMSQGAAPQADLDRARAQRDVAQSEIARIKAVIGRKTIRAPFRARIGISDVHQGQYLSEGTVLTTLQGVGDAVNVDFTVAQEVAASLRPDERVDVFAVDGAAPVTARITAVDSRVDPTTRNAMVRATLNGGSAAPAPGASVRVVVPVGAQQTAVAVPVSALRKGPAGDHVFVIAADSTGKARAHVRQVRSGNVVGDEVLILEGLKAGEQVAASGSFKLREAVLVAITNQQAPPTAPAHGASETK
jgi:membrane fusion protein (multidrug efflux system)